MTFSWSRLTWPALAIHHAGPWSRKISATSRAGRVTEPALLRRRLLLASLGALPARKLQIVKRADDGGDQTGCHTCVACRRLQLVVSQKRLNRPDIDTAIEQVRCERVSQRVHGHRLGDAGRPNRSLVLTREVAGRHRPA